jgi:hypothetical protein
MTTAHITTPHPKGTPNPARLLPQASIWATKMPSMLGMLDIQAQNRTALLAPYRFSKKSMGT